MLSSRHLFLIRAHLSLSSLVHKGYIGLYLKILYLSSFTCFISFSLYIKTLRTLNNFYCYFDKLVKQFLQLLVSLTTFYI
jgi:hypothetical protein